MSEEKIISIDGISINRDGKMILNEAKWDVKQGEHWTILGLNGSGKTTLLNTITGYIWPTKGRVEVLGNLFGKTNIPELRKSIGLVSSSLDERYQSRFTETVKEVVISGKHSSIGLYEEITEEEEHLAISLLERFHVTHLADQHFRTLSQGQKRRVMLARALMAKPKLLIVDEPCNGLDILGREKFLTSLEEMCKQEGGPTLIYVTHHIEEIVPSMTNVLLLHSGEVVASGKKIDVLTDELLSKTFNLPISVHWENERAWISMGTLTKV